MNNRFEFDRLPTHFRDFADLDLAAVEIGVEQGHPVRRPRHLLDRGRAGQDQHPLGDLRGRDPDFAARQHIMVAAALGAGFEPGRVEPGVRFGHRKAGLFRAGDQWRQKAALLLVAAKDDNRVQSENVHMDRRGAAEPRAQLGDRLHEYRGLGDAEPAAAVIRRHGDAEPPGLGHRPVKFVRKAALVVFREPVIVAEPRAEPQHRCPDLPLLLGQGEAHAALPTRGNSFL